MGDIGLGGRTAIRVAIIEDQRELRQGLALLIDPAGIPSMTASATRSASRSSGSLIGPSSSLRCSDGRWGAGAVTAAACWA